jgi:hypothetical protein
VSASTPLHESNLVQLPLRGVAIPPALRTFLEFHLSVLSTPGLVPERDTAQRWLSGSRIIAWLRKKRILKSQARK